MSPSDRKVNRVVFDYSLLCFSSTACPQTFDLVLSFLLMYGHNNDRSLLGESFMNLFIVSLNAVKEIQNKEVQQINPSRNHRVL